MSLSDALSLRKIVAAVALSTAALAIPTSAQTPPNPPNGGGQPGQPGQPGGGGRGNFRQQFEDRMKEQLGVTDDAEWKALQPRIQKVMELRGQAAGGGFGGRRGGRGGDNGGGAAPDANANPVQEKSKELRDTLENKSASADEIKTKLAALREARTKAKADLTKAQEELRGLVTARQEAVLVTFGMLE